MCTDAQREQLSALLDDIYGTFLRDVATARGKTPEQVAALLDEGAYDPSRFVEGGWVTGLKYEDELNKIIEERTGSVSSSAPAGVPGGPVQRSPSGLGTWPGNMDTWVR
jgi:protease-4